MPLKSALPAQIPNAREMIAEKRKEIFLETLSATGRTDVARDAAGLKSLNAFLKLRREDDDFAAAWEDAKQAGGQMLKDEAIRRGVDGVLEPVYYKGQIAGYRKNYSDGLLTTMLKSTFPDEFADRRKVDGGIDGKIGIALLPVTVVSTEEWEKLADQVHNAQELDRINSKIVDGEYTDITPGKTDVELKRK